MLAESVFYDEQNQESDFYFDWIGDIGIRTKSPWTRHLGPKNKDRRLCSVSNTQ